jgi:hypothetical protein
MTKGELKDLMEYLQAIDNRQLSPEKLQAWFDLIGHLDYGIAKQALLMASSDEAVGYVEAKHIIANSYRIKERIKTEENRARALEDQPEKKSSPMPKCVHNIGLLLCDPCCHNAAVQAGLIK